MKRREESQTEFALRMVREEAVRNALTDLHDRIARAQVNLLELAETSASRAETKRLVAKSDGAGLAKSYIEEMTREYEADHA